MFEKYLKEPDDISWRALAYFNFYRFLIAFLFVSLYWVSQLPAPLGNYDRFTFAAAAHIYLLSSILFAFFIQLRQPRFRLQVAEQVATDVALLVLMMYASAGLASGFGMLLIITVAGGSILSPGRLGVMFAAIAALAVLGHELYTQLLPEFPPPNYTHAGILGVTFFVTAIICQELTYRVDETKALAKRQAADLENLSQLNDNIVQRMQSGIIVIDDNFRIRLLNSAAKVLLQVETDVINGLLGNVSAKLDEGVRDWLAGRGRRTVILRQPDGHGDIQASFSRLSIRGNFQVLIFLDDMALLVQRAQQIKLASLGRLTASIAHEVRNPLGAISHAGQLLAESEAMTPADRRLTAIIQEHSLRVNRIIENIMSISRRKKAEPTHTMLRDWLQTIVSEFRQVHDLGDSAVRVSAMDPDLHARMDPEQLRQVIWNLLENALRYGRDEPLIGIDVSINPETERPYIDIMDNGPGIESADEDQLFEPFFTTSDEGSGLGLYIARELCEANQATLTLQRNSPEGCCFRITFPHPEKQHSALQ